MEFFFPDDLAPRTPPEATRILDLRAEPYPDRVRVRVNLEITPFQQRPHLEVTLFDADGTEVTSTSLVEPLGWKLEFTLHLRNRPEPAGLYRLRAILYYPDGPMAEPVDIEFAIPGAE